MQTISIEQGLRALQRFVLAEWRLALPVALAFLALPPFIVGLIVAPLLRDVPATMSAMRALGQSMPAWVTPLMLAAVLIAVVGALALMALMLLPRISVGEAIATAVRRLPAWIGASLIAFAILFAVLIVIGLLVGSLQSGPWLLIVATLVGMVLTGLYLVLIMPLLIDKALGPIAALQQGFFLYRGQLVRLLGGLVMFLVGAWIVATAIQVALGSVLLLIGRMAGQIELAATLVTLLGALVSALEWGAFYLLVACFYRQRVGRG
ncbi:hypothetical protein Q4F19_15170 [Sphingomonas sp. BIUV-7]|uniref:Glycerophosphoryl diester phosphodiesterase membrane domain-containing protein n=1 Tax=Sphingomonas natans TaxID=3063330 RepID=A0ABT8YBM6_9SPHN|nr:hypothetical protein [Sphingomonas sp. BIUV-7]MDO6415730.1 hypothetical protein [Sphingomonas sp. BIUV-7]